MPEFNYTELDFTNIGTMDKVFTGFYRMWVSTCREIVANVVDDYTVTQNIDELEQLTRLHCGRAVLNNNMILFSDVFVRIQEPEGFDPATSNIEVVFIYKYTSWLYINASLSIHIDRPNRMINADSLVSLKENQDNEWVTIVDEYWHDMLTFQKVKEMIHGCLI